MTLDTRARASAQAIRRSRTRLDAVAGLDELLRRRRRQPLRRTAVAFAVLVVVAAIWAGLALRPMPQPALGPVTRFRVGPAPVSVAVTPDAAWVFHANDGTIARIDPGTGQVRPSFTVTWGMLGIATPVDAEGREAPVLFHYATVAEGRLWLVHPGIPPDERVKVTALDPSTGRLVTTIKPGGWVFDPYGKPGDLAVGPGAVWVALQGDDQVRRFDPTTGKLVDRYALKEPTAVAVDGQTAWVATADGRLHRIDTATGAVTVPATTELVYRIRIGQGGMWLMTFDGNVLRADRRTGKVVAQVPGTFRAADLAVGVEGVWVYDQHQGSVLRIDPATNRVTRTIPVISQPLVEVSSRVLALGGGAVWVVDKGGEALVRVDPTR